MLIEIIWESLLEGLHTMLFILIILLPILVLLEYIRHYGLLERISGRFKWLTQLLDLPPEAILPLIIGLFIGIFLGAAVIVEYAREGILQKRDLLLIGIFLAVNHSVIEENLLLVALGANLPALLVVRFIMAFLVTRAAAYYLARKDETTKNIPA